ncbi:unnamed protein product [Schistosoma guineensis]|nr:unnamed protein product [Schistosoma guineensis]
MSSRRNGIAYSVRVLRLERYVAGMSWSTIPPHLRTRLISHGQKVCELYKAALYDLKAKNRDVLKYRYHAVLMRARFEENRNIKDAVLARKMLEDGWAELKQIEAPYPYKYPDAPGGAAYGRETVFSDFILKKYKRFKLEIRFMLVELESQSRCKNHKYSTLAGTEVGCMGSRLSDNGE